MEVLGILSVASLALLQWVVSFISHVEFPSQLSFKNRSDRFSSNKKELVFSIRGLNGR